MKKRPHNLLPTFVVGGCALLVIGLIFANLGLDTGSTATTGGTVAASAILFQLATLFGEM